MRERVVTGILLVIVIFGVGYIDNFYLTWGFLGAIYLVAIYESLKLFQLPLNANFYTLALGIWVASLFIENSLYLILIAGATFLGLIAYRPHLNEKLFMPFIYPTIPFLALLEIYEGFGVAILGWLVVVVALTDTMAYFVGKSIGKRPFSPTSPKKTLEGVAGGVLFGAIGGVLFGIYLFEFSFISLLLLSLAVSIFSIFGDLFESSLKRGAGIKDSGNILPGHGGILDRVDGYMLSAMVLFAILNW